METPTGSPIGSPTPTSDNVILPSESDAYLSAIENPVRLEQISEFERKMNVQE